MKTMPSRSRHSLHTLGPTSRYSCRKELILFPGNSALSSRTSRRELKLSLCKYYLLVRKTCFYHCLVSNIEEASTYLCTMIEQADQKQREEPNICLLQWILWSLNKESFIVNLWINDDRLKWLLWRLEIRTKFHSLILMSLIATSINSVTSALQMMSVKNSQHKFHNAVKGNSGKNKKVHESNLNLRETCAVYIFLSDKRSAW